MLRIASSLSFEANLSKRSRLMLRWELGRLAEPISEWWNGRHAQLLGETVALRGCGHPKLVRRAAGCRVTSVLACRPSSGPLQAMMIGTGIDASAG